LLHHSIVSYMKTISEFRAEGRSLLTGHLNSAALFTFVYLLFAWLVGQIPSVIIGQPGTGSIFPLFTCSFILGLALLPLEVGYVWMFLTHKRGLVLLSDAGITSMYRAYQDVWRVLLTMFVKQIYIMFWTLLLIVPGIIKAISYSMTAYVLYDYPELSYDDAITRSSDIMRGHKMQYFLLILSFIGWFLLGLITLGIGFIWIYPYITATTVAFYDAVRNEYESSQDKHEGTATDQSF